MAPYVFEEPLEWSFEKLGHRGKLFQVNDQVRSGSHLIIEIDGRLPCQLRQRECDFVYYVIGGRGTFRVEDRQEHCGQGDLITIPKGSKFTYEGHGLRMLLHSTPAWYADQEEVSDEESD